MPNKEGSFANERFIRKTDPILARNMIVFPLLTLLGASGGAYAAEKYNLVDTINESGELTGDFGLVIGTIVAATLLSATVGLFRSIREVGRIANEGDY
ncbi:MAG: hypothetical protein ACE5F4_01395 [Candidatus Paceibacteria bacterium]